MTNVSRRSLAKGAAWTVPAVAVASAAPAMAVSCQSGPLVSNEKIDFSTGSRVWSDAPVPGSFTAGQFTLNNNTQYAIPTGFQFTLTYHVITPPSNVGASAGYQSYISTTATPALVTQFNWTTPSNAKVGQDGVGYATLKSPLEAGSSLLGTWSGAPFSLDFENSAAMRYTVSISTPSRQYTYDSTQTVNGCTTTTHHVVDIVGGTWTYDNGGKGV